MILTGKILFLGKVNGMGNQPPSDNQIIASWKVGLLSGLLFLPYLLGFLFPDTWWATHFTAFLTLGSGVFCLVVAGLLFSMPWWGKQDLFLSLFNPKYTYNSPIFRTVGISLMFGMLFFSFQNHFDFFGDAPTILVAFDDPDSGTNHWGYFLSPDIFHPRSGERTVLNLVALVMEGLNCNAKTAFSLLGAISGALYVFIIIQTVRKTIKQVGPRIISVLGFLAAPSILIFMGHIEIYAPLWPVLALFGSLLLQYFNKNELKFLLWLLPVLFLALKLHPSSFLLVPVTVLMFGFHFLRKKKGFQKRLNWKWMSIIVVLPMFVAAMAIYFGVLGDHRDPRFLGEGVSSYERLFLPLFSPEAPLDRYNLFSVAHLLDYLNLILLWSPIGIGILLIGGLLRKQINWNKPEILMMGLLLLMYAGLFFLVNPLLGMPLDWDLMAIPAPILCFFTLLLVKETESHLIWKKMTGAALGIFVLLVPMFYVHSQPAPLSLRLESIGRHTFRTYWIRSAGDIQAGLSLIQDDTKLYARRYEKNIEELKPSAIIGKDLEFATLAAGLGKHYRKISDLKSARTYHELAFKYYPELDYNLIGLVECAYFDKDFQRAIPYCESLIRLQYPSEQKALAIGIEMALRAHDPGRAQHWVGQYRQSWPEDPAFRTLDEGLQQRRSMNDLIMVFEQ